MTDAVIEQAALETEAPPEAPLSIAEHASQFGPGAVKEDVPPAGETPEQKIEREHHSAQQRREKETGKFEPGKQRHRAKSQQASPEDVPRIQALTAKLREAEAEVVRLKTQHAPPAQIARAEAKVEQATPATAATTTDKEPAEDDATFAGDYGKFLSAHARWSARDELRQSREAERAEQQQAQQAEAQRSALHSWSDRVSAAQAKYQDFEAVAFGPTIIPSGSVVDTWIMEHKAGPDVLYYLQAHRQELDSLLTKPVLEQVEDLALLSQRVLSPPSASAGTTGSATGRQSIVLPPRPPNPVRTEAQRASVAPPPTDGSLSIAEHAKAFGPKRR